MRKYWLALLCACGADDSAATPPADASAVDVTQTDVADAYAPDASDATTDAGWDASLPKLTPYERFPQVDYLGGALLTSMKVVTITFSSDDATLVSHLQTFGDTITQTPWWKAATSEYCVMPMGTPCIGQGSTGGHVVLTEAPPALLLDTTGGAGSTLVQFIQDHVNSGLFPDPDPQLIYMMHFPGGTTIKFDGTPSCSSWGAYHESAAITPKAGGAPVETAYAVEPRCGAESYLTFAASHELIEAATDAHPSKDRGYAMQDYGMQFFGDEVGDLCDMPWYDFLTMTESGFNVQRGWSNLAGRTGHDPCVVEPMGEVYFNVAPEAGKQTIYLSDGESTTFNLEAYSEGSTDDWNLSATDISDRLGENKTLSFSFDKTVVNDGQIAKLTVTMTGKPTQGFAGYMVESQSAKGRSRWGASVRLK